MTMGISGFKTKADLKRAVGLPAHFIEVSLHGPETKCPGDNVVVGPSVHDRRWYATVTVDADGIITKVR